LYIDFANKHVGYLPAEDFRDILIEQFSNRLGIIEKEFHLLDFKELPEKIKIYVLQNKF